MEGKEKEQHSNRQHTLVDIGKDPSILTTQFVWREVASLKELLLSHISRIDNAVIVAHEDLVRVPTEVQKAVGGLQSLMENKIFYEGQLNKQEFRHIEDRFEWIDKIRLEQKNESTTALNAALASAKELVTVTSNNAIQANLKQEAAFNKQIDQLTILVQTLGNTLGDKITDLKDLVTVSESKSRGKTEGVKDFRDWVPWVIAIGTALWAVYKA